MAAASSFEWYDYLIFVMTLLLSLAVGLYFTFTGGRQRTTKEYLLGDRQMTSFPVAASIVMSTLSALMLLGATAETHVYGSQQKIQHMFMVLGFLLASVTFMPMFYRLQITSVFEVKY